MEITVTQFKAKCLQLVEAVQREGEEVLITRHGVPAAKLIPLHEGVGASLFGRAHGTVKEKGSLLETGEVWDAEN
jgi:prevent-host-death family protein